MNDYDNFVSFQGSHSQTIFAQSERQPNQMQTISFYYELPQNLSVSKFLNKLNKETNLQITSQQSSSRTFYDSFDWRLYRANLICELNQSQASSVLSLINRITNKTIATQEINVVPSFSHDFNEPLRSNLTPLLSMRALLPLCTLVFQEYQINLCSNNKKTIAKLTIEEHANLANRAVLSSVADHHQQAHQLSKVLRNNFKLSICKASLIKKALKLHQRKPKDYSSKTRIKLSPEIRSDQAGKLIFIHLLNIIKANQAGIISNSDSEYLHDFRVSVRRTRAALSQLKYIFPSNISTLFIEYFAWLGQSTNLTRDMDVYLLNFEHYKQSLPEAIAEDLNPLVEYIKNKQNLAHKQLAIKLSSNEQLTTLARWEQYLNQPVPIEPKPINAKVPIKMLADQRIWKSYQRVIKEGNAIDDTTAAIALHNLRKTCKKLRYLMEFFKSLYPKQQINPLIKSLKGLQNVLGDFQDYEVQEVTLKEFSTDMLSSQVPAKTFLAIDILVQNLQVRRLQARENFATHFAEFKQADNLAQFKDLFRDKHSH